MEPENKLDKLFNERFSGLEIDPSTDGWPVIESRLGRYNKRRGAIYWRWAATAAAIVLAFFSGYYWQLQESSPRPAIIEIIEAPSQTDLSHSNEQAADLEKAAGVSLAKKSMESAPILGQTAVGTEVDVVNPSSGLNQHISDPVQPIATSTTSNSTSTLQPVSSLATIPIAKPDETTYVLGEEESESHLGAVPDSVLKTDLVVADADPAIDYDKQLPTNSELTDYPIQHFAGFSLGVAVSPTLAFNSVTLNDQADVAAVNINNDKVAPSFTAGIEIGYRGKKRWALETGVFINQWTQTNDRLVARSEESLPTSRISIYSNNSTGNLQFNNDGGLEDNFASSQDAFFLVPELDENYTFLEVPLSVSYYLIDGLKWSWKLKGGVSSRFLTGSSVQLSYEDGSTQNVENLPLNSFSLQLLAGTGVEYRLNPKLRLNLTPSIQYGLTPVNQHAVVDTYFHQFLIYSGLSYMF